MNKIRNNSVVYSMSSKNQPVLEVESGSTVVFETCDCFENQICNQDQPIEKLDWNRINPATGPLYIKGAELGDTIKIDILNIDVNDYGIMAAIPGSGIFGDSITKSKVKILPIKNGRAIFNDSIYIPCEPMIGVIGVAPKEDSVPNGEPGSHGGNMDNNKIVEGSTLYLPVFHSGALLSMGDLHAAMGDGEVMVTGIEVGGKVTVKVDLLKNYEIRNPILEYKDKVYTIASHEDLFMAVKISAEDMLYRVMRKLRIDINEAGMLLSAIGDTEICQVVDPKMTARFSMPKWIFSKEIVTVI